MLPRASTSLRHLSRASSPHVCGGRTASDARPLLSSGVSAVAIASGSWHTCTIEAGGAVKCWGYNADGRLGIGSTPYETIPVIVPGGRGAGAD